MDPKIDGWKSKWGAILLGIGTALFAMGNLPQLQELSPKVATWFYILGIGIDAFGGPLFGIGIAHKIQKAGMAKGASHSGYISLPLASLTIATMVAATLVMGCAPIQGVAPEDRVSVCNTVAGCEDSWICQVLAKQGFIPEDVNGLLLDGNAIALIAVKEYKKEKDAIATYIITIRNTISQTVVPWNYAIDNLYTEAMTSEDYQLILGIIQRRFSLNHLKSGALMKDCDRRMVVYHLDRQLELLGYKAPAIGFDDIVLNH